MRSRNIKPGFFSNELLGSNDPLLGWLFAGLWGLADREGRLEDRPLRICALIFPYRRNVSEKAVDKMLTWLDEHDFIRRYTAGDNCRYIQVLEFSKHQTPHSKESPSKIPALTSNQHRPRSAPGAHLGSGEHALIPDSGFLIPDSPAPQGSPPTPSRGRNGLKANGGKRGSLAPWREVSPAAEAIRGTQKTWAHLRKQFSEDPLILAAVAAVGDGDFERGCRIIADRDRYTTKKIEMKFREAYERLMLAQAHEHH